MEIDKAGIINWTKKMPSLWPYQQHSDNLIIYGYYKEKSNKTKKKSFRQFSLPTFKQFC